MAIAISNYQVGTQIYESANSLVYRGIREEDNQPVILKVLKQDYPTPAELTRYKQEYEITRNLDMDGAVKAYGIETYQRTLVIILEDFGGKSLKQLSNGKPLKMSEFLNVAIQATGSLAKIHSHNVIHKDINPSNIVFNPDTGQLKIIDFGISTVLTRENPTLKNPNVLEGTLAYISPEQTGRMNRSLDYRTDFYSLGVTFYELLTGQLPFNASDALELVHCHIAKQPMPPHEINPDVPQVLSELVLKLLAKNAEDRYKSAWGIKADLEQSLAQLEINQAIPYFLLGSQDVSDKFQIPQKLYGREAEISILLAAFDRIAGIKGEYWESQAEEMLQPQVPESSIEMMLVAGYSGIGKSALVAEVHKPITERRGYFISGKFDQFQRNIPYSAAIAAFSELARQLLTEDDAQLLRWREKILDALGPNAQVIIDVIPEIELIIGSQPPVASLGPAESQNRFNLVFQNFIRVFCSQEHPLVIFLDDLQWADSATLKLIQLMMTDDETGYLFLIGAYRDNEVNPGHPLMLMLEALNKQGATVNQITLAPLKLQHVTQLTAETVQSTPESVKSLATLVTQKTGGNPFFVNEFLKTLNAENLLIFDFEHHRWQWDIKQIEAQGITDNVVELMIGKLRKLPPVTQRVIRLAACMGAEFDLSTLALINETPPSETFENLSAALKSGLILAASELNAQLLIQDYKFLHDRVQQAAYALIDESRRKDVHLKIGRLLLQNTEPETLLENIFAIVDHLNQGLALVGDPDEQEEIAQLNLLAGRKATEANAYAAAVTYLLQGRELLSADSWQVNYSLSLQLYEAAVEAEYLNANYEQVDALSTIVFEHANTILDKINVYQIKIQACISQNNQQLALDTGLQVVEMLGVELYESPPQLHQEIEALLELPVMSDPHKLAAMDILTNVVTPAWTVSPKYFKLTIFTMVNLSIEFGNCSASAFGYVWYGTLLCESLGDIDSGYRFGQLAINLLDKFEAKNLHASVFVLFATHVGHWRDHTRESLPWHIEGLKSGLETGNLEYASYGAAEYAQYLFLVGEPLESADEKCHQKLEIVQHLKQDFHVYYLAPWCQGILNLRGQTESTTQLQGDSYDETACLEQIVADNQLTLGFSAYFVKAFLCYLFQDYGLAVEYGCMARRYTAGVFGTYFVPTTMFYQSLARLAHYDEVDAAQQAEYLQQVSEDLETIRQWAEFAPMNHQHKCELIAAEQARLKGRPLEAMDCYERAIQGARENGYVQEEAIACERAAEFYLSRGMERIAQAYMMDARYSYARWEATAKIKQLNAKYPALLRGNSTTTRRTITTSGTTTSVSFLTSTDSGDALDLATVAKAARAVASEIVLDKLLSKLMKILVESAGAKTGHLILETDGQLLIEASGALENEDVMVLRSLQIEDSLPTSIVNYVARTRETVVLNDAVGALQDPKLASGAEQNVLQNFNDPYISKHQSKSILCAPLINQGKLSGIVYLENDLIAGAFTPDRLELLKMIVSQAAISLDNARLYQGLQQSESREREKAHQLSDSLNQLQQAQLQLVQSEKMASLGQLVAGVAHEINNPVNFISSNLIYASDYVEALMKLLELYQKKFPDPGEEILTEIEAVELDYLLEDLPQILASMQAGTKRIAQISKSMRTFSRADTTSMVKFNVHDGIDSTLLILKHRLKANEKRPAIEIERNYGDLPDIEGYPGQLNQVFMNLIANAIDALDESNVGRYYSDIQADPNQITITTELLDRGNQVAVRIQDNGVGMTPEIKQQVFDQMFTTKAVGKGTGLGLSISRQIVEEKHKGKLKCVSSPGLGTEFIIEIPM